MFHGRFWTNGLNVLVSLALYSLILGLSSRTMLFVRWLIDTGLSSRRRQVGLIGAWGEWSDSIPTLRAHLDQVPLNYPSETVVQPSSTAHFHYGFPTVEPLSRYSNKLLSSNLKTAIFQPCKRCHTP